MENLLVWKFHELTCCTGGNLSQYHAWIPNLSQMFVEAVCMPRCWILYNCGHGSDWNTWIQLFEWVSQYFWQFSVCLNQKPIQKKWKS